MPLILAIYADCGTKRKILLPIPLGGNAAAIEMLNDTLGGNWDRVDRLQAGEAILFEDGLTYLGWSPDQERYSDAIIKFKIKAS